MWENGDRESYASLSTEAADAPPGSDGLLWAPHLMRQIQADVYGQKVETVEVEENAAYGAAIMAGVGAKAWPSVDAACDTVIRVAGNVSRIPRILRRWRRRTRPIAASIPR